LDCYSELAVLCSESTDKHSTYFFGFRGIMSTAGPGGPSGAGNTSTHINSFPWNTAAHRWTWCLCMQNTKRRDTPTHINAAARLITGTWRCVIISHQFCSSYTGCQSGAATRL